MASDVMTGACVPLQEVESSAIYGGKCHSLGAMLRDGLPVPSGYALDPKCAGAIAQGEANAIARLDGLLDRLGGVVAVRSSGLGEDGVETSFAGQHATVLGVTSREGLIAAVAKVVASAQSDMASGYREAMEIGQSDEIAVAIQQLVQPEFAGVIFTRNPVTGDDERVIEAIFGLGEALVSGMVSPAQYRVSKAGEVIAAEPAFQEFRIDFAVGKGVVQTDLPEEMQEQAMLELPHIGELNRLANDCERVFGGPQDIEWCIAGGKAYLLQSRPITTL